MENTEGISRCGPFKVHFPSYDGNDGRDVGISPYLDPCDQNVNMFGEIEFCAVFDEADGAFKPAEGESTTYLYIAKETDTYELWYTMKTEGHIYSTNLFMVAVHRYFSIADDFILNLGTRNESSYLSSSDALDIDYFVYFFAVYDKELLDTVNEYYNPNDNYDYVNGFKINDWTSFFNNSTVTDSVAYAWGGTDNVDEFNWKMDCQLNTIWAYYDENNNSVQILPNPNPADHKTWVMWNNTTAPDYYWRNYIAPPGDFNKGGAFSKITINNWVYYPYIPGYSTYRYSKSQTDPSVGAYEWQHATYSAGIDCSGFVQRAAGYDMNPYSLEELPILYDTWDIKIDNKKSVSQIGSDLYSRALIDNKSLVPGDIIINATAPHVAIVSRIDYPDYKRSDDNEGNVFLIEAARGNNEEWRVINTRRWFDLSGYVARRLR